MRVINTYAARTHFSRLVNEAAAGEDIVIARAGKPIAKLVALTQGEARPKRRLGLLEGQAIIPKDFDAPLPESLIDAFEGR